MLPSLQACLCYFAHALATLRARRSQARDSSFKASQVRATIKDIKAAAAAAAAKEKAREDDVANLTPCVNALLYLTIVLLGVATLVLGSDISGGSRLGRETCLLDLS